MCGVRDREEARWSFRVLIGGTGRQGYYLMGCRRLEDKEFRVSNGTDSLRCL
jgi:hypothetical protein